MADSMLELHKAHRDRQEKYTYFLLAAAGAAIGFAITQTRSATLSYSIVPLGIAVLCWGASFICGNAQLWKAANLLQQNYQFLRMEAGLHPQFPPDPELIKTISKSLEEQSNKSGRAGRWQYIFLIVGACFFVIWHVLEMYLRTAST